MKQEEPLFYNDYKRKSTGILKKKKKISEELMKSIDYLKKKKL